MSQDSTTATTAMSSQSIDMDSPIGILTIVADDDGITHILFPNDQEKPEIVPIDGPRHRALDLAREQLSEYFAGNRQTFELPLAPRGTDFQQACWDALDQIPFGETVSYGEQAERLGRSGAARAVGAANGQNHLPIVRPCHRVIGANGSLTGFAGGIESKRWLLQHEARVAGTAPPEQPGLF